MKKLLPLLALSLVATAASAGTTVPPGVGQSLVNTVITTPDASRALKGKGGSSTSRSVLVNLDQPLTATQADRIRANNGRVAYKGKRYSVTILSLNQLQVSPL